MSRFDQRPGFLRLLGLIAFAVSAWLSWRETPAAQPRAGWATASDAAQALARTVLNDHPSAVGAPAREALEQALGTLTDAIRARGRIVQARAALGHPQARAELAAIDKRLEAGAREVAAALGSERGLTEWRPGTNELPAQTLSLPFRSGLLLVRRERAPSEPLGFVTRSIDLASGNALAVDLPDTTNTLVAIRLMNAPEGVSRFTLTLRAGREAAASMALTIEAPSRFLLEVAIRDRAGNGTEAAVGLYSSEGDFLVPDSALDFSAAGFAYEPVKFRSHMYAGFWPGGKRQARCFFVRGGFRIELPPGSYRLIASKGPEFIAVDESFTVDGAQARSVRMKRWTDMSARGWHSGDCHIHYARPSPEANERLLLWARAEDLRMGNILRMGDARETYFEQYAFGRRGRFLGRGLALVPGQEDPRTRAIGHTISLNLPEPVRDPARYYLYSLVFDRVRGLGGLTGYAHVNTANFAVYRDMAVNVPRGRVDFAEICEFGHLNWDLYYEFLNLGFRLTAAAGSDAPWGGTIGDSRVYVFTGWPFDADQWFAAFRAGRTFVTTGPMLEFSVNGRPPGEHLRASRGRKLRIRSRMAFGWAPSPPGPLEIVVNGEVRRAAPLAGKSASLAFDIPAEASMWIAARTAAGARAAGAHTTPVYVTVDGGRHWKREAVQALLAKRGRDLDEIEGLLATDGPSIPGGSRGSWENAASLRRARDELHAMIEEARQEYGRLRKEFEAGQ